MKVKVVKTPNKRIKPLYSQDKKTFSLDTTLVSYPYGDKGPSKIGTQYPEVPEDQANIEAEKGETILTPELEHYTIGGKTHKQGGTPIKAEIGSFIFSNDKKLKIKGHILEEFGIKANSDKAKEGMTPADVAKKYKTNKFLAILRDTEAPKIDKDTASLMLGNYKNKLSKVAFIQEAKKNFPNGVPDLAKSDELIQDEQDQGYEFKKGGLIKAQIGFNAQSLKMLGELGKDKKTSSTRGRRTRDVPRRPSTVGKTKQNEDTYKVPLPKMDFNPNPWEVPSENLPTTPQTQVTGKKDVTAPTTYEQPIFDTGYGTIDYVNMSAPFLTPLKKYPPIRTHVQPQNVEFRPIDLEAQRQGIKGQASRAYEANDILSPTSSAGSVRNSEIFGQSLDPLNQSYMTEFNANQAGRMQVDSQNAGYRGQADAMNAQSDDQYNVRTAITNENFDTEKRVRLQQFLKGLNVAEKARQFRNAANVINRDFAILANGQIARRKVPQDQAEARLFGDSGASNEGDISFEDFKRTLPPDVLSSATPSYLYDKYDQMRKAIYRGKDAQGVSVTSRNPYLIPQPYDYSTLPNQ